MAEHSNEILPGKAFTGVLAEDDRNGERIAYGTVGELPGQRLLERLSGDPHLHILEIVEATVGDDVQRGFMTGI